jgi:Erg28 like protein
MYLILINGIYDIISSFLLLLDKPNFHIYIYSNSKKRKNKIRQRLLGYWIFTNGTIRCLSYYQNNKDLANLSYITEIIVFLYEYYIYSKHIYLYKIVFIVISCNLLLSY